MQASRLSASSSKSPSYDYLLRVGMIASLRRAAELG
jgi:hypothetical protein